MIIAIQIVWYIMSGIVTWVGYDDYIVHSWDEYYIYIYIWWIHMIGTHILMVYEDGRQSYNNGDEIYEYEYTIYIYVYKYRKIQMIWNIYRNDIWWWWWYVYNNNDNIWLWGYDYDDDDDHHMIKRYKYDDDDDDHVIRDKYDDDDDDDHVIRRYDYDDDDDDNMIKR